MVIPLEKHDFDDFFHPHGPLFYRWLPDGEKDAIYVKTHSKNVNGYCMV